MTVNYGSRPFPEAIDYLRDKVNLPTATWTDIWEGQHARAFTVAGAARDDLLVDLRESIRAAIEDGETLAQFRTRFDAIVKRHGWAYNGGRNWRTRVIYETNMRTAYQAGRYQQLQAIKDRRPFWLYKHSDLVTHPRPEHEAWDGLVLDADDPWWDTHYPPNGWGCRCTVRALNRRELARMGKSKPDEAPPGDLVEKTVGIRGPNPRTVRVPEGVDPGWGYNVGKAAYGQRVSGQAMEQWRQQGSKWRRLIQSGYAEAGRPRQLPLANPPAALGPTLRTQQEMVEALASHLGGPTKQYTVNGLRFEANAAALAEHLFDRKDFRRTEYFPFIDDALSNPAEVWLNFEEHSATGRIRLVSRLVKAYDIGRGRALMVVANASQGYLVTHTLFTTRDLNYLNRQRQGELMYVGEEDVE